MLAVHVIAADNIWAGGTFAELEHWNGVAWQVVPLQSTIAFVRGSVTTITGTLANDLWIAGEIDHSRAAPQDIAGQPQGFVGHRDAQRWSLLQPPDSLAVESLDVASAHDIWVTGISASTPTSGSLSHWDGQRWEQIALPISSPEGDCHVLSWRVMAGWCSSKHGSTLYPLLFHGHGQTWHKEPIPAPEGIAIAEIQGQTWAVGGIDGSRDRPFMLGQRTWPLPGARGESPGRPFGVSEHGSRPLRRTTSRRQLQARRTRGGRARMLCRPPPFVVLKRPQQRSRASPECTGGSPPNPGAPHTCPGLWQTAR